MGLLHFSNELPRLQTALMSPQNPVTAITHLTPLCHDLWFCAVGLVGDGAAACESDTSLA